MLPTRTRSPDREAGFTLIELLVVMLILGILSAIALPAFFSQKGKAGDAKAKEIAHTAQVAMETCATEHQGGYDKDQCNLGGLHAIEPTLPNGKVNPVSVSPAGDSYSIDVTADDTGNVFSISRDSSGSFSYTCTVSGSNRGGCPTAGKKGGTWGN